VRDYGFGIDLGGTTCKLGLFEVSGKLLEKWEIPTNKEDNGTHILEDIANALKDKMKEKGIDDDQIQGAGIGVPGAVTPDGWVNKCVNLGWNDKMPIEAELSRLCGFPVKAANDANIAALGEAWMGAGKGAQSLVMITLGTGIGGGIIINGQILTGSNGAGGEIGHIHVDDTEEEACGCGNKGCIEQYASATGIVRMAKRILEKDERDSSLRSVAELTAKDVFDAAKAGDAVADTIVTEVCGRLGSMVAKVVNVLNPEMVLLGGGVSKAGQIIIDKMRPVFREEAFHACKDTKVNLAVLGNDAGIYGGVGLLLN
jgi:glucokinase